MPLFISEEELSTMAGDVAAVAERADDVIRDLRRQIDTIRAEADAAAINSEQNCSFLEGRFASLTAEFELLQGENARLSASADQYLAEIASFKAEKNQLGLQSIEKDGKLERLAAEISELQNSKRITLEIIEQRDAEIAEKTNILQSYHEKILHLTTEFASKEARLNELERDLGRTRAMCDRVAEEKELLSNHNSWLDEELRSKVNSLAEIRKASIEAEAEMTTKIYSLEREVSESASLLQRTKEKNTELERRISDMEKELCSSKESAAASEQRLCAELSTVKKLAELYKESSQEWSKKAGELEGVIKALEAHSTHVEDEYKDKLEKETVIRKELEKEVGELKSKLEKYKLELESARKDNELTLLPLSSFRAGTGETTLLLTEDEGSAMDRNEQVIVPRIPCGISGTALAASLLRDGWSLVKIYEKYQEAADALRHETMGRKNAEAILERVMHEIEKKAKLILDERAEYERMVEAYSIMSQKLQQALLEHDNFESTIRTLKADLKKRERDYSVVLKEMDDLQTQVAVLLNECQRIQLHGGSNYLSNNSLPDNNMSFKDIKELVDQNVFLKTEVQKLSFNLQKMDAELKEDFQAELQKAQEQAMTKVEVVLKRSQEQGKMIESLHSSVAMYKKLYEEEHKARTNARVLPIPHQEEGKHDLLLRLEGSQEASKKASEIAVERARNLEQEAALLRSEITTLRSERDKMALQANFAKEKLDDFMMEFENQKKDANALSARNAELTKLLVDFQKQLRERADSLQDNQESYRKLSVEVAHLKHEKEILTKSENRAMEELRDMSERVHRLQTSIDVMRATAEVHENARMSERQKQEDKIKQAERNWADAKKELQEAQDLVRTLTTEKRTLEVSIDGLKKQLADALRTAENAESRAITAEAKHLELHERFKRKGMSGDSSIIPMNDEDNDELLNMKRELEKQKEEARASQQHMLQYKDIANSNEVALKLIETAHAEYRAEAERSKKILEDEISSLRSTLDEMERKCMLKSEESSLSLEAKERQISSLTVELSALRNDISHKLTQIDSLEFQIDNLKGDLAREQTRRQTAQENYERQVVLQSETIQELTSASKELCSLQSELSKLQDVSKLQQAELDAQRASWNNEKMELLKEKDEAQRMYREINEQNEILHKRLDALHVKLADKDHTASAYSSDSTDLHMESDLQNVISYLRRSKEIAETEIFLLKQEKSRLQCELEIAQKASKDTLETLRSLRENAKASILKDEDFKSLQLQVREINLLRESNMQLREESKHNLEECQRLRDITKKAKDEVGSLECLLREKQLDSELQQKDIEKHKLEIACLQDKLKELVEITKNIDPKEFDLMKEELKDMKARQSENIAELDQSKVLLEEKSGMLAKLEDDLSKCRSELSERELELNKALHTEGNIRSEIERSKRIISTLKRKMESLTSEKDGLFNQNNALLKQIEELKTGRKASVEPVNDSTKEKDTRIQVLENLLEKERDDLRKEREDNRKEKSKRQKNEHTVLELLQTVNMGKQQVETELAAHKQALSNILEKSGVTSSQVPSQTKLDEQTLLYFSSVKKFEETTSSIINDGAENQSNQLEIQTLDVPVASAAKEPPNQQPVPSATLQSKTTEERVASAIVRSGGEVKKVRRLIRPALEKAEEPQADTDISAAEDTAMAEQGKSEFPQGPEPSSGATLLGSSRKRKLLDKKDDSVEDVPVDIAATLKRTKEVENLLEDREAKPLPLSSEIDAISQDLVATPADNELTRDEMDIVDELPIVPREEIIETAKEEDDVKGDTEEHQEELDSTQLEEDVQFETSAAVDDVRDKAPQEELLEETHKGDDLMESVQNAADEEDEREEGELRSEEFDQQPDDNAFAEVGQESTSIDRTVISEETVIEKSANPDTSEDVTDRGLVTDRSTPDPDPRQIVPSELMSSPSTLTKSHVRKVVAISHPRSTSSESTPVVASGSEEKSGTTISIAERAKEKARLRQAGMPPQTNQQAPPPPASRGRATIRSATGHRKDQRGGRGRGGPV